MENAEKGVLALADGRVFWGRAIGATGTAVGEVVFTTALSGYQEVLTDPSYADQIVTMTCAEIGNVGANREDMESDRVQAAGLIVRSSRPITSSHRAERSFRALLVEQKVVAVEGVDTRALVLHLRDRGAQMGVISTEVDRLDALLAQAKSAGSMVGRDLAQKVSVPKAYRFEERPSPLFTLPFASSSAALQRRPHVVVYDFGVKRGILRRLTEAGAQLSVVPAKTPAEEVLAMSPDGVLLSNGPGDPEPCDYAILAAKKLRAKVPLFGICLGFQILALSYGARSYKLKFGHRGSNHPVRQSATGRVMITSQNHGFAIDAASLSAAGAKVTEISLNDQTCEGFEVPDDRVLAVQYHPEASPGPHDSSDHFQRFLRLCSEHR